MIYKSPYGYWHSPDGFIEFYLDNKRYTIEEEYIKDFFLDIVRHADQRFTDLEISDAAKEVFLAGYYSSVARTIKDRYHLRGIPMKPVETMNDDDLISALKSAEKQGNQILSGYYNEALTLRKQ